MMNSNRSLLTWFWRLNFVFMGLQGLVAMISLINIPGDTKSAALLSFSFQRILLILVGLLPIIIGIYGIIKTNNPRWVLTCTRQTRIWLFQKQHWSKIIIASTGIIILNGILLLAIQQSSYQILAPPDHTSKDQAYFVYLAYESSKAYLIRLQPLFILFAGLSVQAIIVVPWIRFGTTNYFRKIRNRYFFYVLLLYGLLIIGWAMLGGTNLKIVTDTHTYGWQSLGSPVQDHQALFIFINGLTLSVIGTWSVRWSRKRFHQRFRISKGIKVDLVIGLVIWIVSATYWGSIPASESWFSTIPRYPNFESYPKSDATVYDTSAHNLLTGMGFRKGNIPIGRRPVYTAFLALLYALTGTSYQSIILLQSAIFAILPALGYLLARILHHRLSGVIVAFIIAVQEANAIALMNKITVTNSKLIMSETPATIGVMLFSLLLVLQLKKTQPSKLPLIAGGILGATIQIRIETSILLAITFLLFLILIYKQPKMLFVNTALVTLGMVLFIAPWIWRNWEKTGQIYLETPGNRIKYVMHWSNSPTTSSSNEHSNIRQGVFWKSFMNHYAYNQVQAILIFPDAYRLLDSLAGFTQHHNVDKFLESCCSRENYINRFYFWTWRKWDNVIPTQSVIPILVNLLLLSIGIVTLWANNGIVGLFPLFIGIAHYAASSVVRMSGGRFIRIVEWGWILYYGVGLTQLLIYLVRAINKNLPGNLWITKLQGTSLQKNSGISRPAFGLIGLVIFITGASIPLAETLIPPRYTESTKQEGIETILQSTEIRKRYPEFYDVLEKISSNNNNLVLQGRALYPRYYDSGDGEEGTNPALAPGDSQFFYFTLVGPTNMEVRLPLNEKPLIRFPHAADVLLIGCESQNEYKPLAVFIQDTNEILLSSAIHLNSCISP